MRGNSSVEPPSWWEFSLDWPVEYVPCELEVVEPRRLTALEWAVLKMLEAFEDSPPSIQEAVEELGLGEPQFLEGTLHALLALGALTPRPGIEAPKGLEEVLFTERGLELFRKGQVDGEPSHPGCVLHFDTLTDEAIAPPSRSGTPKRPVIDASSLPPIREEVGLDRVRAIVQQFGPSIGGKDAFIRSSQVLAPAAALAQRSGHHWVSHSIGLTVTSHGKLALRTPSLTPGQRLWLTQQELTRWIEPPRAVTGSWTEVPAFRRSRAPLSEWQKTVDRLLPIPTVSQEAQRLIGAARREVLLHAAWVAAPGVEEALSAAARRGVAVYVLGAPSTRLVEWSTALQRRPGFIVEAVSSQLAAAALVVDGSDALLLDEVQAEVEESNRHAFEVAGATRTHAAALRPELRRALLSALPLPEPASPLPFEVRSAKDVLTSVNRLLGDAQLQLALARLVLEPESEVWARIQAWLCARAAGADRVAAIHQVADMAGRLVPEAPSASWQNTAMDLWRGYFAAILAAGPELVLEEVLRELIRLAPTGTRPEEILDRLVERWVPITPATRSPEPLRRILKLRQLGESRWPKEEVARSPGVQSVLDRCLEAVPPLPEGQPLLEIIELVEKSVPSDRAKAWAEAVANLWSVASHLREFKAWRQRHDPLKRLLGTALLPRLIDRWKALLQIESPNSLEQRVETLRCVQGLLPAPEAVAHVLAIPTNAPLLERIDLLVQWSSASKTVWGQEAIPSETWSQFLRQLLPSPAEGYAPDRHGPLLAELPRRLQGWPGGTSALKEWERELAVKQLIDPPPVENPGRGKKPKNGGKKR